MDKVITIKITKQEYEDLISIHSTGGAEVLDYEGEYDSLVDKGLITISDGRGPGKRWKRAIVTFKGEGAIYAASYRTVIEG